MKTRRNALAALLVMVGIGIDRRLRARAPRRGARGRGGRRRPRRLHEPTTQPVFPARAGHGHDPARLRGRRAPSEQDEDHFLDEGDPRRDDHGRERRAVRRWGAPGEDHGLVRPRQLRQRLVFRRANRRLQQEGTGREQGRLVAGRCQRGRGRDDHAREPGPHRRVPSGVLQGSRRGPGLDRRTTPGRPRPLREGRTRSFARTSGPASSQAWCR